MEANFKKKLQLSKTVVANLSKQEMDQNAGGLPQSAGYTCGTACLSNNKRCAVQYSGGEPCNRVISMQLCYISTKPGDNVTCGTGYMCGSDMNNSCICGTTQAWGCV